MIKKLLFSSTATQKRVAILEDGKVAEYIVEQPDECRILGNIYRGRVSRVVPSIQSAFIDIGLEKNAFLNVSDIEMALIPDLEKEQSEDDDDDYDYDEQLAAERADSVNNDETESETDKKKGGKYLPIEDLLEDGQEIIVQVCKEPIGDKSPKVMTKISLAGRFTVLVPDNENIGISKKSAGKKQRKRLRKVLREMLPDGMGCIVRTIGLEVDEELIYNELKQLVAEWDEVQRKSLEGEEPCLLYKEQNIITSSIKNFFSNEVDEVLVDNTEDYNEIVVYLNNVAPEMLSRVSLYKQSTPLFDAYGIEKDLDKSHRRKIWLKSGGYLYFDKTEALLAIDVNSGRNNSEDTLEDTVFAVNMEAAKEITRQLRLRDVGGIIVVDFIDMKKGENRHTLEQTMREYLKNDSTNTACTDLSRFGLMEMTRKRVRPGINEMMTDVCPSCNGLGRIFSTKTIASKLDRWLHRAAAEEGGQISRIKILTSKTLFDYIERNNLQAQLESNHKIKLFFEISSRLEQDEFEVYTKEDGEDITEKHL
ncbi:MAG: Rne/Rng family ribonuclease [Chitinivibrionia bacterium]|nr:Rne/Rng family ribonuclease [Chitinivibrionia bacterium]